VLPASRFRRDVIWRVQGRFEGPWRYWLDDDWSDRGYEVEKEDEERAGGESQADSDADEGAASEYESETGSDSEDVFDFEDEMATG